LDNLLFSHFVAPNAAQMPLCLLYETGF
jgi:hypothetical protein